MRRHPNLRAHQALTHPQSKSHAKLGSCLGSRGSKPQLVAQPSPVVIWIARFKEES